MQDVPSAHAICIELCAGSARLSATLRAKGLQTYAVDHSRNRHSHQHGIITIDLANDSSVQQLVDLLDTLDLVVYVHAAPPCGTCSRARERRIQNG